ncbi:MAG TPA: hypothetical protein VFM45_03955 [Anaeromyxobacteraceae bacterium]|nr:hypothetical protein [Anaeromyxobacteraceae bacterium]
MWKPVALVALALALEGAFVLNAVVPDPGALARARAELRPRDPSVAVARAPTRSISDGAIARAR